MRPPSRTRFHPWARRVTELDPLAIHEVSSERELKFKIPDAESFQRLLQTAAGEKEPPSTVQRNHIFDTPERDLFRSGYRLRLREEDGRWLLTAKGPKIRDDSSSESKIEHAHPEVESLLSAEAARTLVEGIGSPLEALAKAAGLDGADRAWAVALAKRFEQAPIGHLGMFQNERFRVPWQILNPSTGESIHCTLELDRTRFPGGRLDHELEVEVPAGVEAGILEHEIRRWLEDAGVMPEPSSGKAKRFFKALDEQALRAETVDRFS